jgi:hypothetical protein
MSDTNRIFEKSFTFLFRLLRGFFGIGLTLIFAILGAVFTIGLFAFFWQVYLYFRFGSWVPYSMIDVFQYLGSEWAISPSDWVGFYNIFDSIPASVGLMVVGLFFSLISHAVAEFFDRKV